MLLTSEVYTVTTEVTPMAKKQPPRHIDRHTDPRVTFHLEPELRDAMAAYIAAQEAKPNSSEVMRQALRSWLRSRGFWPWPRGNEER